MNENILLIEDDEALAQLVQLLLERAGYMVRAANNGEAGLEIARAHLPDLVLLDILMPDMDGWHVYEALRRITDAPVLFLTALGDEHNITYGLGLGADDYIVKPFGYKELVTRVKASLSRVRRARGDQTIFQTGNLWVNLDTHEVKIDNRMVNLTPTEFQLLSALIQDSGRTVITIRFCGGCGGRNIRTAAITSSSISGICGRRLKKTRAGPCGSSVNVGRDTAY
jgi:two-component system phosphate regulon response regulator PhoB